MTTAYNRLQTTKKDNGCKPLPFYSLMKIALKLAFHLANFTVPLNQRKLGCDFIIHHLPRICQTIVSFCYMQAYQYNHLQNIACAQSLPDYQKRKPGKYIRLAFLKYYPFQLKSIISTL